MLTKLIVASTALTLAVPCLADSKTRTSRFEYDAQGFLIREIIEPDDSLLCLVTTYAYDAQGHGNPTSVSTRNCNGTNTSEVIEAPLPTCPGPTCDALFETRTTSTTYAAGSDIYGAWVEGQFPTYATNALLHPERRTFDPRFGGVVSLIDPNNLPTRWTYDGFGRKASETRADSTATTWTYKRCVDFPSSCPNAGVTGYAVYFVTATATGAPTTSTYYDSLNREIRTETIRTETQALNGVAVRKDISYDISGNVAQINHPYWETSAIATTVFRYDILGRVIQSTEYFDATFGPDVLPQTQTITDYNGLVTTITVSNNGTSAEMPGGVKQVKETTKNSQGQVIKVIRSSQ